MSVINSVIDQLQKFSPLSIFLYGSRAGDDFLSSSDYEIGCIFPRAQYVSRSLLQSAVQFDSRIKVYPYILEELQSGVIDTPFQPKMYLRDILSRGKTLFGEQIIEGMDLPNISNQALRQDIRFSIGIATAAVIAFQNNELQTANNLFIRSFFYGLRNYFYAKDDIFLSGYGAIYDHAQKQLQDSKLQYLTNCAHSARINKISISMDDLFQNIKFLTKFVEPILMSQDVGTLTP